MKILISVLMHAIKLSICFCLLMAIFVSTAVLERWGYELGTSAIRDFLVHTFVSSVLLYIVLGSVFKEKKELTPTSTTEEVGPVAQQKWPEWKDHFDGACQIRHTQGAAMAERAWQARNCYKKRD